MQGVTIVLLLSVVAGVLSACPWQTVSTKWSTTPPPKSGSTGAYVYTVSAPIVLDMDLTDGAGTKIVVTTGGQLIINDQSLSVTLDSILVQNGAYLLIGAEDQGCSLSAGSVVQFTFTNTTSTFSSDIGVGYGAKGIVIEVGGNFEAHGGYLPSPSWVRLNANAPRGSTTLTLDTAVNWRPLDLIVLASTDYDGFQSENFTITAISADKKTLTLDHPVVFLHWGSEYERAEVGVLTRNIKFQGDAQSALTGFGYQLQTRAANTFKIEGVECTKGGQKGVLGRYPIHIHLAGSTLGKNYYVRNNGIHHNYQRCVTIHDSNGIYVSDNVAYDTIGHCYFLEDGPEELNTFDHNLGVLSRDGSLLPSDSGPGIFWLTNSNNTVINNAAVGAEFGFWYALPLKPVGVSKNSGKYVNDTRMQPRFIPLLKFSDNVAHSHNRIGLMVDEGPNANDVTELCSFTPQYWPYITGCWENCGWAQARYENLISYKNREHGAWSRGSNHLLINSRIMDNLAGVTLVGEFNVISNCIIVGETSNPGTPCQSPPAQRELNCYASNEGGRARPRMWELSARIVGHETYDFGGATFCTDTTFINFTSNSIRPAGVASGQYGGPNMHGTSNRFQRITMINANVAYNANPAYVGTWSMNYRALAVADLDGSFTGTPGSFVVTGVPFVTYGRTDCTWMAAWNAYSCPHRMNNFAQVEINNLDAGPALDAGTTVFYYSVLGSNGIPAGTENGTFGTSANTRVVGNLIPRRGYALRYISMPTPKNLEVQLNHAAKGEWVVFAIPYPAGTTFTVYPCSHYGPCTAMTAAATRDDIDQTHYYWDATTNYIYVKVIQMDDSTYDPRYGFSNYYGSANVQIKASCSTCTPASLAIPADAVIYEDSYKADLQGCQFAAPVTTSNMGTAFFTYDPKTRLFATNIHHTLGPDVTGVQVVMQADPTQVVYDLTMYAPVKSGLILTRIDHQNLYSGAWAIRVTSNTYPTGELLGRIGCQGTCTAPPPVSTMDPCVDPGTNMYVVYNDSFTTGWYNVSWGYTRDREQFLLTPGDNSEHLCGVRSFRMVTNVGTNNPTNSYTGLQIQNAGTNLPAYSSYTHLEFFVKRNYPTIPFFINLRVQLFNQTWGVAGPEYQLRSDDVYNWGISGDWSRVRIPLSLMVKSGTTPSFHYVQLIVPCAPYPPGVDKWLVWFDNLRFVNVGTETLTAYTGAQYTLPTSAICTDAATSAGASSSTGSTATATSAGTATATSATATSAGTATATGTASSTGTPPATSAPATAAAGIVGGSSKDASGTVLGLSTPAAAGAGAGLLLLLILLIVIPIVVVVRRRNRNNNTAIPPRSNNEFSSNNANAYSAPVKRGVDMQDEDPSFADSSPARSLPAPPPRAAAPPQSGYSRPNAPPRAPPPRY